MMNTGITLSKSKQRPTRAKRSNRKDKLSLTEHHQKTKSDDSVVDEGYHSGNPPTIFATQHQSTSRYNPSRSTSMQSNKNGKHSPLNWNFKSTGIKGKTDLTNKADRSRVQNGGSQKQGVGFASKANGSSNSIADDVDSCLKPAMLHRTESRTFVFVYDEDTKKSNPVTAPENLNVDVPVLLQYGLTEEAIEQCLENPALGTTPTPDAIGEGNTLVTNGSAGNSRLANGVGEAKGGEFEIRSPTERLLRCREKDEMRNRGMHVVKWLVSLNNDNNNNEEEESVTS